MKEQSWSECFKGVHVFLLVLLRLLSFIMTQITFIMSRGSRRLHPPSVHPPPSPHGDSLLANICRLMSPLTAITTHNVITPLNSLLLSALWLLLPAAHKHC